MLDPNRYALDAATVGFRTRMGLPVNWANFNDALQTQTESIKVRRELEETPISEVHVMGGERFGIAGNSKTNELARQARQMNGYPLRSFYATGGAIVLPSKHGEGLMATPQNVGLTSYAQYNGVVGNLVSSFTEPLNAPLDSGTMVFARAGIQAKSESITNPFKYLQFMLNMNATQEQIQANEQQHRELRNYNAENAFALGEDAPAAARAMQEMGASRAPGSGTGIANHLPNINSPFGVQYGVNPFGYMQPNEPENVIGDPAKGAYTMSGDRQDELTELFKNMMETRQLTPTFLRDLKKDFNSNASEDDKREFAQITKSLSPTVARLLINIERGMSPLSGRKSAKTNVLRMLFASTGYDMQEFKWLLNDIEMKAQEERAVRAGVRFEEAKYGEEEATIITEETGGVTHFSGLPAEEAQPLVIANELLPGNDGLIQPEARIIEVAKQAQERTILENGMEFVDGEFQSPPTTRNPVVNEQLIQQQISMLKSPKAKAKEKRKLPVPSEGSLHESTRQILERGVMAEEEKLSLLYRQRTIESPDAKQQALNLLDGSSLMIDQTFETPRKEAVQSFQSPVYASTKKAKSSPLEGSTTSEARSNPNPIETEPANMQYLFDPDTEQGKAVLKEAKTILQEKYGTKVSQKDLRQFIKTRDAQGISFASTLTGSALVTSYARINKLYPTRKPKK